MDVVRQMKIQTHYVGRLRKKSSRGWELQRIESHDYVVLMQKVLSLYVQTIMSKEDCMCTVRLSRIFKLLSAKTIDP